MDDQSITLSDERVLGFRCIGDPKGRPLFFFHGTPGSRFVLTEIDLIAQVPGIRFILPERPGYGISDPKPGRTLLQWPNDVAELADFLGLDSFAVSGVSGGGPHALACAARLPDRVRLALLFSSPSPAEFKGATRGMSLGNKLGLLLGRAAPWLVQRMIKGYAPSFKKNPARAMVTLAKQLSPSDQLILEDEAFRDAVMQDMLEGFRQGGDGHAEEAPLVLSSRNWGFDLSEIAATVHLWHGDEDPLATVQMAKYLENEIPNCHANYVPGAGHLLTQHAEVVEQFRKVMNA